jgi:hypothetical protein
MYFLVKNLTSFLLADGELLIGGPGFDFAQPDKPFLPVVFFHPLFTFHFSFFTTL